MRLVDIRSGIMKSCPVCHQDVLMVSPKHIGRSSCECDRYDVHSGDNEESKIKEGVLHVFGGRIFMNRCKEEPWPYGRLIVPLKSTDMSSQEFEKELDALWVK